MPWRSWISAVFMIVVIAVSAFIRKFENTEQCLTYVDTFVNSYVHLMQNSIFQLWFCDTVWRIVKWFVVRLGFAIANTLYYGEYSSQDAVHEEAVLTVLVSTAPVSTTPAAQHIDAGDAIEYIEVLSSAMAAPAAQTVPAMAAPAAQTVPAMAAPAAQAPETAQEVVARMKVEQDARKAAREAARGR